MKIYSLSKKISYEGTQFSTKACQWIENRSREKEDTSITHYVVILGGGGYLSAK